jgi:hypothetical protein
MADPSELRTETVRVDLAAATAPPADQNLKQTVRIQLPVREHLSKPQPFSTPLPPSVISPAPTAQDPLNSIGSAGKKPMLISWILLLLSALILIIQIWTYLY